MQNKHFVSVLCPSTKKYFQSQEDYFLQMSSSRSAFIFVWRHLRWQRSLVHFSCISVQDEVRCSWCRLMDFKYKVGNLNSLQAFSALWFRITLTFDKSLILKNNSIFFFCSAKFKLDQVIMIVRKCFFIWHCLAHPTELWHLSCALQYMKLMP